MNIRYQVSVHTRAGAVSNTDRIGPFASNEFVGVDLFEVNKANCEALRKHFSNNRSLLQCSESPSDYVISDFLDPVIQATINSIEQRRDDAENIGSSDLPVGGENCWALAYEVARLARSNSLDFHTWDGISESGEQLWNMFETEGYATKINDSPQMIQWQSKLGANWTDISKELQNAPPVDDKYNRPGFIFSVFEKYAGKMPDPSDNNALQPGDVLLVGSKGKEMLVHAAIFVAPGIYFERTQGNTRDFGGGNRLVFSTEIMRMYGFGGYTHWRIARELPRPQDAFRDSNGLPVQSKRHKIIFNARGVAHYEGTAL
jgi:hypothetical protein